MEHHGPTPRFNIMKTADDAVRVKAAAVHTGYYDDPYIDAFATNPQPFRPVHVIIKRGTFARVKCVERVIRSFLYHVLEASEDEDEEDEERANPDPEKVESPRRNTAQVVLLGAGKDTAMFRLRDDDMFSQETIGWYEVDQDEMIGQKLHILKKKTDLFRSHNLSRHGSSNNKEMHHMRDSVPCWNAHFIAHDFVQDEPQTLTTALIEHCGLDPNAPTLIVTECVQMYLPVQAVDSLLQSFLSGDTFTDVSLCSYEPILQSDAFGTVMETNLRKAHLLSEDAACVLVQRRTIPELLKALRFAGAVQGVACDMKTAYDSVLTKSQQERARKCEFLDELEEWNLIMTHYCLIVATNRNDNVVARKLCAENSAAGFPGSRDGGVYRFQS